MYRPLATGESELSLPVIAPDGTLSSWEAESKLFNTLPPLGFLRVYSTDEPGLREEVNRFCHAFFGG